MQRNPATNSPILDELFQRYSVMPNGGALLTVSPDGTISDGMRVLAKFNSRASACRQLRKSKFLPTHHGYWAIYTKANAMNG